MTIADYFGLFATIVMAGFILSGLPEHWREILWTRKEEEGED